MREELQKLCEDFIVNRDVIRSVFRTESAYMAPVCANIFCVRGMMADARELRECRDILKEKAGPFSRFRGNIRLPLVSLMASGEFPFRHMEQAQNYYAALLEEFHSSEYLALAAFLLTDMVPPTDMPAAAWRAGRLFDRMKKAHPFLTDPEDTVFSALMAATWRPEEELTEDMERSYSALRKRFGSGNAAQTAAQVLTLAGAAGNKTRRLIALYDELKACHVRYGRSYELGTLAALSVSEAEPAQIVLDILETDDFLSRQKGYGAFGVEKRVRLMHAALIVSDVYAPRRDTEVTTVTSTVAMIAAKQAAAAAAAAT